MNMGRLARAILAALLSVLFVSSFAAKQGTSVIKGLVTIQAPGGPAGPLGGVTVAAVRGGNTQLTTTDATGHYTLDHLIGANYKVSFVKANYLQATLKKLVLADNATAFVNAAMTPVLTGQEVNAVPQSSEHLWTIRNPNSYPVTYTWKIPAAHTSGSSMAFPGVNTLDTGLTHGAENIQLFVNGYSVQPQSTTQASAVPSPASILGSVTDNNSSPLQGVSVTVVDVFNAVVGTDTTDVNGSYSVESLAPGTYTVGFGINGFTPQSITILAASGPNVLNVTMAPVVVTGNISGIVTDTRTGSPLSGALIELHDGGNNTVASTNTLADGSYSLTNVLQGSYTLVANQTGYTTVSIPVTIASGTTTTQNVLMTASAPPPTCNVAVTVKSAADNTMIPGVTVTITYSGDPTVATGVTDATGMVQFSGQPVGATATVIAQLVVNGQPLGQTGQLVTGGFVTGDNGVQLLMASGSVAGVVADQFGGALFGAEIDLVDSNNVVRATTFSGPDGTYVTPGVTPGIYTVEFSDVNYVPAAVPNVAVISGQQVQVGDQLGAEPGAISGVLTDSLTGLGVYNETVQISGAVVTNSVATDPSGRFNFGNLPVGSYTVSVSGNNYSPTSFSIVVPPNGTADASRVLADSNGAVEGTITSSLTGLPLQGIVVQVQMSGKGLTVLGTGLTDANGHYVVNNVPAGSYVLSESGSGFIGQNPGITVTTGQILTFDFVDNPILGGVSAFVTDQNGAGLGDVLMNVYDINGVLVLSLPSSTGGKAPIGTIGVSSVLDPVENPFRAVFTKVGYQPVTISGIIANYNTNVALNPVMIPLAAPTATVSITVVDANGPVAGATVTISYADGSSSGPLTTDANGNVIFTSQEVGDPAMISVTSADLTESGTFTNNGFVDGSNSYTVTIQ